MGLIYTWKKAYLFFVFNIAENPSAFYNIRMSCIKWNRLLLFCVPSGLSFIVYLGTVCHTLYTGDSGELSAAAFSLSIAHPPGYPLLILLGRAFLIFSWADVAISLNILSALLSSVSAGILAILIHSVFFHHEYENRNKAIIISIAGGMIFGFSNVLWATAAGFEVYSLGIVLIALSMLFLLKYNECEEFKFLLAAVYLFGLSLTNHLSAISLAPALIFFILKSRPGLGRISTITVFFIMALTLYLYLPVRSSQNPPFDWNHPATLSSFLDHITAQRYQAYITGFGFDNYFQNIWRSFGILFTQYPFYLSSLGFIGLFVSSTIKRNIRFTLLSIVTLNLLLSALYDIPDIDQYYLPSLLVLTIGLISFLNFLLNRLKTNVKDIAIIVVVILMAITTFFNNYGPNDQSDNRLAYIYGENILKSTPKNSFLISVGDNSNSSVYYLRYVERIRTDLEIYDSVISVERLKRRMGDLNLRTDLAGPDLCLILAHSYQQKTYIVKEHMLARGNPFNYHEMSLFPNGLVYGFGDRELNIDIWEKLEVPPYEELSSNLDFKGMTMLANLHLCYGEDLFEARKRREAVVEYGKARKIAGSTREASVHNSLGIFFRHEGWPIMARNEYEAALGARHLTANEKSNIYVNLGNLEKDSRRTEDAIEFYLKALDINDENTEAKYNLYLTKAYKAINEMNYRSAAENFEKALDLPDSDPQINLNLGIIYDKNLNNKSKAVFYYKRFMELFPDSERGEAVGDRIKELEINR